MSLDLAEYRPVNPKVATSVPQSTPETTNPTWASPQFFSILEEVPSVKDSITSGLPTREQLGIEPSGYDGPPMM